MSGEPSAITVHPNSSNNDFTIEFNNPARAFYRIDIFDANGKRLFSKEDVTSNSIIMEREALGSGLFNLVLSGDGKTANGKLLLQ